METKEWDFGSMQAKVKVENDQLTWKLFGNGSASYPLRSVQGVQYEKGGALTWMSHIVFLVSGGDNKRVQVPKSDNSELLVQGINLFVKNYHEGQRNAQASPAAASSALIADELTKLAALKQQGILTEDEFQQQKQKLLAR